MPKRNRKVKRSKAARFSRKFGKRSRRKRAGKKIPLITPFNHFVKLRYIDTDTMSMGTTLGTYDIKGWRMNSAYDVNQQIGSTAMPGFSEWAAFYTTYRVMAGKIKVTLVNTTTTPVYFGMYWDPSNTVTSSWSGVMHTKGNMGSKQVLLNVATAGGNKTTLTSFMKYSKLYGNKWSVEGSDAFGAVTSANPATTLFAGVYVASDDGISVLPTGTFPLACEITLWVKFYDRKMLVG